MGIEPGFIRAARVKMPAENVVYTSRYSREHMGIYFSAIFSVYGESSALLL